MSFQCVFEQKALTFLMTGDFLVNVELWSVPVVKIASSLLDNFSLEFTFKLFEAVVSVLFGLWSGEEFDVLIHVFVKFLISEWHCGCSHLIFSRWLSGLNWLECTWSFSGADSHLVTCFWAHHWAHQVVGGEHQGLLWCMFHSVWNSEWHVVIIFFL